MEKLLKKMFEKYTLPGSNSKAADGTCRSGVSCRCGLARLKKAGLSLPSGGHLGEIVRL